MGKFTGKSGKSKPRVSSIARKIAESDANSQRDRDPRLEEGTWRVRLRGCEQPDGGGGTEWLIVKLVGAGDDEEIGERAVQHCISGKALLVHGPRIKTLCMALVGFGKADEDEYNEFDPNGEFVDAITTGDLDAAAAYLSANAPKGAELDEDEAREALETVEFLAVATLGNEADDGSRYVNVSYKPAPDGDSEEDEDEDDEDESPRKSKAKPAKKKAAAKRKPSRDEDDSDDDEEDEDDDSEEDEDEEPPPRKSKASKKAKGRK